MPAIVSLTPSAGDIKGGTVVQITGSGFLAAGINQTTVTFGGNACQILLITDTLIKCLAPVSSDPGPVDIVVSVGSLVHLVLSSMAGSGAGLGTPELGGAWQYVNGTFQRIADEGALDTSSSELYTQALIDAGASDGLTVSCTFVKVGGGGAELQLSGRIWYRADGAEAGFFLQSQRDGWYLYRSDTFEVLTLLGSTTAVPDWGQKVDVQLTGSSHSVYVDGVLQFTSVDTGHLTNTLHGIGLANFSTHVRFKDFSVFLGAATPIPPATILNGFTYTTQAALTLTLADQDVTGQVTSWGKIEQVKEILLAKATMLTSDITMELYNRDGFLSTHRNGALLTGSHWYNSEARMEFMGKLVFLGKVKDVGSDSASGLATVTAQDVMTEAMDSNFAGKGTRANPAAVILGILYAAGLEPYYSQGQILSAGGQAVAAEALINYDFSEGNNTTSLEAIQKISALCSISVFCFGGRIYARTYQQYQGSSSGLLFPITDAIVRQWGKLSWDVSSFQNVVNVGYNDGFTDKVYSRSDQRSIRDNNGERPMDFSVQDPVRASDLKSAQYFAAQYLQRASTRKAVLQIVTGPELKDAVLGDRFPVTDARQGLAAYPMELIELHPSFDTQDHEALLVTAV